MKILVLPLALLALAGAAPTAVLAQAPAAASAPSPDAAALEKLNAEWLTAYKTHDGAALERILADDFEAVYPGGRIMRKADLVKAATNPARSITSMAWEDLKIMVFGDVAVVRARAKMSGKGPDGDFSAVNDYADIYVKRAGAWRAISAHVVRAAE
ncbi:MAG: nuclear transport factor 2 family protein [Caulobacter sp.]|nr:nuclear transport factor 2 family protein [Caulobacter sp.]